MCLIPEIPFELAGPTGLFRCVSDLFNSRGHCVIVVAEGAGMELINDDLRSYGTDASGNVKRPDIGLWLRARLNEHFASLGQELNLKLIEYVSQQPILLFAGCLRCRGLPRVVRCSCPGLVLPPSCAAVVGFAICSGCLCHLLTLDISLALSPSSCSSFSFLCLSSDSCTLVSLFPVLHLTLLVVPFI